MKKTGINSCRSWIIAVSSSIVYCLVAVPYRLAALFYAAVIEHYDNDRERASIPFAVLGFVRCFSGIIYGVLGEKFGLQRVTLLGCGLSAIGIAVSYFARDVVTLSVTLGLIYGFGMTGTALLPNIIRDYFDHTTTTISNGIVSVGPSICALVFSSVVIYFLDEYGLSGAFLLTSGIILNAVPLIMMLKKPDSFAKKHQTKHHFKNLNEEPDLFENNQNCNVLNLKYLSNPFENKVNVTHLNVDKDNYESKQITSSRVDNAKASTFTQKESLESSEYSQEEDSFINTSCDAKKNYLLNISHNKNRCTENTKIRSQEKCGEIFTIHGIPLQDQKQSDIFNTSITKACDITSLRNSSGELPTNKNALYYLNLLKDPAFISITITQGLFAYTYNILITTLIDYSRDKGIDRYYEIYILTFNPVADILGRFCLSWVVDKDYLSVSNFCAIIYILLTITSIWIALAKDFAMIISGIMIMSFAFGAFLSIFPGMSYAFIEKDKQAVSVASMGLMYAPLSFTVSPLIGYFRGKMGSYDGLYYLLAAMNFACSLLVLQLPRLASIRERKKTENILS